MVYLLADPEYLTVMVSVVVRLADCLAIVHAFSVFLCLCTFG